MEENEFIAEEEERQNRTFIILVAALGGLLALGICAFVIWALVGNRWMQERIQAQNRAIQATNTAVAIALAETATAAVPPTDTPVPTDTPQPTPTKVSAAAPVTPTATPREVAEAPTATPEPTATRRPTATPGLGGEAVPGTGIGALGASALAVGLLFLLVVVRRLRRVV